MKQLMPTLVNPDSYRNKTVFAFPLFIIMGLFAWLMIVNTMEWEAPDTPTRKPRTLTFDEVITTDVYGNYALHPDRLEKLKRDIENLEEAEQYVLRARFDDYYPCLSCPFRDTIYLKKNEVWKYGVTINGESGRYRNRLRKQGLFYKTQFEGSLQECMIEERKKIIRYTILPENLNRTIRIARPPGNPNDN